MFEKSLQDLVKGIRGRKDAGSFISSCVLEIKQELKSSNIALKVQALQKLTYLQMLGYDMSWAAFHVIEVMSQEKFGYKRAGFLAASQSFTAETDVIVLCTQLLKKELQAQSQYVIGLAINCLANIATPDLARDLLQDIVTMLTSHRPYVRKKATLVLFKLYRQYPQGLRLTFDQLKRKLSDEDPSVVSASVNVICELASRQPRNYLSLAPDLFKLFTSSQNNWMLIKVAKLMGALVQEEPRLARKLLEPLANIIHTTPAKSLMYECISTVTKALCFTKRPDGSDAKNAPAVVRLCTERLREFVRDPDQNLKYLGLVGLGDLMKSNPRVVAEHRDLVLQCLVDEDITIRLRALELITGMVTRRNLKDVVKKLLEHVTAAEDTYRRELVGKIIFVCSRDKYAYLTDFAWYLQVLVHMASLAETGQGEAIAEQLRDIAVRVEEVRPFAVQCVLPLLSDPSIATGARLDMTEVLHAAAWITGEYAEFLSAGTHGMVIDALLQPGVVQLPPAVQAVYVQAVMKILGAFAGASGSGSDSEDETKAASGPQSVLGVSSSVCERLNAFSSSSHVEVAERAVVLQQVMSTMGVAFKHPPRVNEEEIKRKAEEAKMLALLEGATPATGADQPEQRDPDEAQIATLLAALTGEALKPVSGKAQRKVPVPPGLDLDSWINASAESELTDESAGKEFFSIRVDFGESYGTNNEEYAGGGDVGTFAGGASDDSGDDDLFSELSRRGSSAPKQRREAAKANDPYMLGSGKLKQKVTAAPAEPDMNDIPIQKLSLGGGLQPFESDLFGSKSKHGKRGKHGGDQEPAHRFRVMADEDMPEGVADSESDASASGEEDALAKIDLSTPLGAHERMPQQRHRVVGGSAKPEKKSSKKSKKAKKVKHSSKKPKEAAAAAAPAAAAPEKAPAQQLTGDAVAGAAPVPMLLMGDKRVKVQYTIEAPSEAVKGGTGATVRLHIKVEAASSKAKLDWVDFKMLDSAGVRANCAGLAAGGETGSIRLASKLRKSKSKQLAQKLTLPVTTDQLLSSHIPCEVTYLETGAASPVQVPASLYLPAASLLVAVAISQSDYQAFMTNPSNQLYFASCSVPIPASLTTAQAFHSITALIRSFVVQDIADTARILYAQTASGHDVTVLAKKSEAGLTLTVKSTMDAIPEAINNDIQALATEATMKVASA